MRRREGVRVSLDHLGHGVRRDLKAHADIVLQAAADCIATRIAPKFGVSSEVIAKRLRVEKLWPPTDS